MAEQLLTGDELIEVLRQAGTGERRVEMSTKGIFLFANGRSYPISMEHADVLFSTMFGHARK